MKFNLDNAFFTALGKLVDSVWVSLLWLVCCIPVVTIGASTSALYYTVHKSIRGGRGYTTRNFFSAFKNNFRQATLSWLVWLVIFLVLLADVLIMRAALQAGSSVGMLFYFFLVMMLFVVIWAAYIFPYVARFENTVKATLKNAFLFAVSFPQWSLLLVLIMAVGLFLTWLIPFLIFLLPTVVFLLFDLILERIFRRFMSEEDLKREEENDLLDKME